MIAKEPPTFWPASATSPSAPRPVAVAVVAAENMAAAPVLVPVR